MEKGSAEDRREFLWYSFDKPVTYKVISASNVKSPISRAMDAVAKNLSASGILFTSNFIPEISSIVVLETDYRTTCICREIEESALIVKNRIIGKVVRVEDRGDGVYGVGVAFIKRLSDLPKNIEQFVT